MALRGVDISEKFVDVHLLKSSGVRSRYSSSTDENASYKFETGDQSLKLIAAPIPVPEAYEAKILKKETTYNKEFENYSIMVVDKPLSPEFKAKPSDEDTFMMEKDITSLDEASQFFSNFLQGESLVFSLNNSVERLIPALTGGVSLQEMSSLVHETIAAQWNNLLRTHSLKRQRDARFQGLLSSAIEIYVVSRLHDYIFPLMVTAFADEDKRIYTKTKEFYELQVTADQFGAPEDFAVPLPAAVVELASIDCLTSPVEKLACLSTTMDLIMAEIKGAIVDAHCVLPSGNEPWTPPLQPRSSDLIPLVMWVLVQAKPLHLASNFFYMDTFQWTLEPSNVLSHSFVAFKTAVQDLLATNVSDLLPKSKKIMRELSLEDLIKVTGVVDGRFNRGGDRKEVPEEERGTYTPLDRQLEHLTSMIEASTRELDEEESMTSEMSQTTSNNTSGGLIAAFQNNFGTCLSKQGKD
ncbi:ankyrin repeat domain-containing protein 27-like [Hetaerina americana]|uniref:ankyrin repeat domain-containing protein 27-like n=1 Tax=Hetaerina americana TaxID=62018 RepID=UPI003A7F4669